MLDYINGMALVYEWTLLEVDLDTIYLEIEKFTWKARLFIEVTKISSWEVHFAHFMFAYKEAEYLCYEREPVCFTPRLNS